MSIITALFKSSESLPESMYLIIENAKSYRGFDDSAL
jgi:hypothetical protein